MPIYVGYTQKRRRVKLLDAGNDQVYLCDPGRNIQLRATINDYTNVRNYTFDWEQTEGPLINLTTVDDFTVEFPFTDSFDKKFTFYIDKGTPQEQKEELNVFYTPTSIKHQSVFSSAGSGNFKWTVPNKIENNDLMFDAEDVTFQWDFQATPVTRLEFDDLSGIFVGAVVDGFEVLSSEDYRVTPNNVYLTYDKDDYPTSVMLPKGMYRFKTYYKVDGLRKEVISKAYYSNPSEAVGYHAVNTQQPANTVFTGKPAVIARYRNLQRLVEEILSGTVFNAQSVVSRFTGTFVDYTTKPELTTYHGSNLWSAKTINVSRADPSSIGNG